VRGSMGLVQRSVARHAERVVYRVAGLPVAVGALFIGIDEGPSAALRSAHAVRFWAPADLADLSELVLAGMIWPFGLLAAAAWCIWKNGEIVQSRCGKSSTRQFLEQLKAYFSAGILPPWYYMFELYDSRDPRAFINRFETKCGVYPALRRKFAVSSPLDDKLAFAQRCRHHQLRSVPVVAAAANGHIDFLERENFPAIDLFVKPVCAAGGKGTERWDHVEGGFQETRFGILSDRGLLNRLRRQSKSRPMLVQPRVKNCSELAPLNNDALSTVRIVTCLNERGRPEVVAAAMRMAIGDNHRVDNFHAGGIAAAVDLRSGELGPASNLGMDARLGWVERHPNSDATIRGRVVPRWKETCELAERAHRAFDDRVIVGWDIAPTQDGPIIVEGNGSPDLDIVQRTTRSGLAGSRLSQLLSHHLQRSPGVIPRPAS